MPDQVLQPDAQIRDQAHGAARYRVLLHHDGLHAARYVAQILQDVFFFDEHGAEEITLESLYSGVALCAIEALELAKSHVEKLAAAKLTATMEPDV